MEYVSGNIFIRPNPLDAAGERVPGHTHNFDHTTFFQRGWFLMRSGERVYQFASAEYIETRRLLLAYEPEKIKRPVRYADKGGEFCISFIAIGEPVPLGAVEIFFEPQTDQALIKAEAMHEIIALSDGARFVCVYSHRDPQGNILQRYDGFVPAYV